MPPETAWLLAAALTPVLVARRLLQHQVVTLQTIMGAVAAYLQIAVAYAFLYQTIDAYSATNFFGQDTSTTTYMYFSLVTISTVGYGDFVAVTSLGRLAVSERGGAGAGLPRHLRGAHRVALRGAPAHAAEGEPGPRGHRRSDRDEADGDT